MPDKRYNIAANIWPAYTGDEPRSRIFWPDGYGYLEAVKRVFGGGTRAGDL